MIAKPISLKMNDNSLSDKISNLEKDVNKLKLVLNESKDRLSIAYEYKDSMYGKMKMADENIKKLQNECFQDTQKILEIVEKIKKEFEVYQSSVV